MPKIQVDPAGLHALSAVCDEQASAVAGIGLAPAAQSALASTAAAVRTAHAQVAAAGERIAGRLSATGGLIASAGLGYHFTDSEGSSRIDAVRQSMYEA